MFRPDQVRRYVLRTMAVLIPVLMMVGVGHAAPPASPPVTAQEKQGVKAAIEQLYQAWVSKDLERILSLERLAIEASAADYEKRGKGKAEDVRESFRGCTNDLLTSKAFKMKPLHLADIEFRREGELIVVASAIPIIATEVVEVGEPGSYQPVRMVISKIVFRKSASGYEIVKMNLHG